MDESLECLDVIRPTQCTTSGLTGTSLGDSCTYYTSTSLLISLCLKKCELLIDESDCRAEDCTFIYSSSSGGNIGNCYSKNDTNLRCEDIYYDESNECINGGSVINLNGKCGIYESTCKTKCEILTATTCTSDDHGNYCFLLENEDENLNSCINIVCLYLYIYLFIFLFIFIYIHICIYLHELMKYVYYI
jgi:hypothetical protein